MRAGMAFTVAAVVVAAGSGGVALVSRGIGRPVTPAAPSKSIASLPVEARRLGRESPELAALCNAGSRAAVRTTELFPASSPTASTYALPEGLRHVEWDTNDNEVRPYVAHLVEDDAAHRRLRESLRRGGRHRGDAQRVLRVWNIPEGLIAIAYLESGFDKQESGPWSLTPEIGQTYGLVMTPYYDERRGTALATEVAARYLTDLHERLGSWDRAICAFGVGYGAVCRAKDDAPAEANAFEQEACVRYRRSVTAIGVALANRAAFGLDDVQEDEPILASELEVPAGAPFGLIARASGTSTARLKELNPEYTGDVVPNAGIPMVLHVPAEGLARAKEMLLPLLYAPGSGLSGGGGGGGLDAGRSADGPSYYRVREGDTFEGLVSRLGVDRETLASDNALDPASTLRVGRLLAVRRASAIPVDQDAHF